MRISAHRKKELIISGILCISFYSASIYLLHTYINYIDFHTEPKVYAGTQNVQGEQTSLETIERSESAEIPTPTTILIPTKTSVKADITAEPTNVLAPKDTPVPSIVVSTPIPTHTPIPKPASSTTQSDILSALNNYRKSKNIGELSIDSKLQSFAQGRADHFASTGSMDNHAGFQSMMSDDGFSKMGFNAMGENSSFGQYGNAKNLIETIYGGHSPHDENQLNGEWTHVGIGVNGDATNLVFGGRKQ